MAGPAEAGLFIYAKYLEKLATFYQSVLGAIRLYQNDELIVLESQNVQLLIHKIADDIAKQIEITIPPVKRENTALKFFFTVPSINQARSHAEQLGGAISDDHWQGTGFMVCNAIDPEGNIFHLREKTS